RKRWVITVEQQAGETVGAKEAAEDEGEPEQAGHLVPVGGNEAHGAEADQHRAEDGEHGCQLEAAAAPGDVAADGGLTIGGKPARLAPAREVLVETPRIARHEEGTRSKNKSTHD